MDPVVSVILLNFKSGEDLPACLGSLLAQTFPSFEVLLVDQGQKDGSTDQAVRVFGPSFGERLKVLWAGRNLGFAGGCNLGFAKARGRWVALLNTDALADPGWLAALVEAGEADPRVGMCASRIRLLEDPGRIENTGHHLYPDGLNVPRGRGQPDGPAWDTPGEVLCPSGAAGLYRMDAVRSVGGFDARFFAYGEDLDLGLSLRAKGFTCRYVPDAGVRHQLSGTWGRRSLRKAYLVERNRTWVAIRHFPPAALVTLPVWTALRWGLTLKAGLEGQGPLSDVAQAAFGRAPVEDAPARGWLRGRGAQAGAVARLALMAGAAIGGQAAGLLGAREQLRSKRERTELKAEGSACYADWLRTFGASADEAARQWLDGTEPTGEIPAGDGGGAAWRT